jgi:hypothetical protein
MIPELDEPWPPLSVRPIPNEPLRYWVQSASRPDIKHIVDLAFREDQWSKAEPWCSCERIMAAHDPTCKHISQVIKYEQERQALMKKPSTQTNL